MRTAIADTQAGVRERSALERLAVKLQISPEVFNRELNKLQKRCMPPCEKSSSQSVRSENKSDKAAAPKVSIIESLSRNMVSETLRATLTCADVPSVTGETAELIYTLTSDGDTELELIGSGFDLAAGKTFSVMIDGKEVCEIAGPLSQHMQPIRVKEQTSTKKLTHCGRI